MTLRPLFAFAMLASCAPDRTPDAVVVEQPASRTSEPAAPPATAPSAAPASAAPAPAAPVNAAIPGPASAGPVLAVDGEGLRLFDRDTGSARVLAFGQARAAVLGPLETLRGPAGTGINQDCGAGPVAYANWPDGLSLVFQDGRFAGWGLDGRAAGAITTAAGIGPGSTRAQLADAYAVAVERSSLGTEFMAGGISGVLDGAGTRAKITDMWAGVSCVAR